MSHILDICHVYLKFNARAACISDGGMCEVAYPNFTKHASHLTDKRNLYLMFDVSNFELAKYLSHYLLNIYLFLLSYMGLSHETWYTRDLFLEFWQLNARCARIYNLRTYNILQGLSTD